MISLTGDIHGDREVFIKPQYSEYTYLDDRNDHFDDWQIAPAFSHLSKEDTVIVCGDFGYIWTGSQDEEAFLDALSRKIPFKLLFVDGNHENFDLLYQYPEMNWCGGRIHYVRQNVYHLMRGEIFEIDGFKVFALGGAASTDTMYRVPGVSWWPQEVPTYGEIEHARANLKKHDNCVDLIVTHAVRVEIARRYRGTNYKETFSDHAFTDFLEEIAVNVEHKAWVHGHYHVNQRLDHPIGRFQCLYDEVISVNELL